MAPEYPMSGGAAGGERRTMWLLVGIVVALLGVGLSIYSINHHLEVHATGHTDAACNINSTFSCDEVALSKYSEIAGVPLGVFGLGYFAGIVVLLGMVLAGAKTTRECLHGYAALVLAGVLSSIALAGISAFALGHYCPSCIAVYVITFIQLIILLLGRRELIPPGIDLKSAGNGAMNAAIVVALVIAGYNFLKPSHTPKAIDEATQPNANPGMQLSPKVEDIPLSKSAYAGLGEDYRKGGDNATVVIEEFADFQCPACKSISMLLDQLHKEYGDKILVVYRNYPLDNSCNSAIHGRMHDYSCKAAVMARCAGQYGKFWDYHNMAFENQRDMSEPNLKDWAKKIGLTQDQINACWDNKDLMAKVQDDIALGNKLGIDSTPTVYMNGHKVVGGRSADDLRADINGML